MNENLFDEFPAYCAADWEEQILSDLKGQPKEGLNSVTEDGIKVSPNYFATTAPIQRSFRNKAQWSIASSFSQEDCNEAILESLSGGCNALIVHVKDGVDFSKIFDNVMLDIIDCTVVYHGSNLSVLEDDLSKYVQANYNNNACLHLVTDSLENTEKKAEAGNHAYVNSSVYRNAGCTAVQEMEFALAQLTEILISNPKSVHIQIGVGPDYFCEIAKIRAFRSLIKDIADAFNWNGKFKISATPCTYYLSTQEVNNNLLRLTTMTMSAVIGGADQIALPSFDFTDSAFSNRITRNIQLILEQEAFLSKVNDPALGAYFIEELTRDISQLAWANFQDIEREGGFLIALKNNTIASRISASHKKRLQQYENGKKVQIDSNTHVSQTGFSHKTWNGIKERNLSNEISQKTEQ
jgi:methylmalonyl-CoA mutase